MASEESQILDLSERVAAFEDDSHLANVVVSPDYDRVVVSVSWENAPVNAQASGFENVLGILSMQIRDRSRRVTAISTYPWLRPVIFRRLGLRLHSHLLQ